MKTHLLFKQIVSAIRLGGLLLASAFGLSSANLSAQTTVQGPNTGPMAGFPSWYYPNASDASNASIGKSTSNTGPYYEVNGAGGGTFTPAIVSPPIKYTGPNSTLNITANFDVDVQDAPGNTSANIICYYYVSSSEVAPSSINWTTNPNSFLQTSFNFISGSWQSKSGSFTTNTISTGQYVYFMLTVNTSGNAPYLIDNIKFTINGAGNPLSVGYAQNLTAVQKNTNSVLLNWATATENNSKGFWIERSTNNGNTWLDLDFVPSNAKSGNSSSILDYSYIDISPMAGANVYRLKQEDLDGTTSFSNSVSVNYTGTTGSSNLLLITPNPVENVLNIKSLIVNNAAYKIFNISGQVVKQSTINSNSISVEELTPGIYFLQIQSNTGIQSAKFIKK